MQLRGSPGEPRRRGRVASALLTLLCLLGMSQAQALRPVQVYAVTVHDAAAGTVVMDGMRAALVRATGRRDAPANPQLAGVVQNAAQYLKGSRVLPGGAVQLDFDGVLLAQAISAAGAPLWDSDRPFTLVTVSPVPTGPAGDALRVQVEQTAEERGLPVSLVPLTVNDAAGVPLPDATILASAEALGGDAVLIGRADPATPGQYQWHLVSSYTSAGWSGAADAGVNGAADSLAATTSPSGSGALEQVTVQVAGVSTLTDYARVEQLLRAVPGVQSSGLTASQGSSAVFTVAVRGGGEALVQGLAGSGHLSAAASGVTQVQLNYVP